MRNFALRTVKNGSVKINGVTYFPKHWDEMPYDNRFEGLRFAFGLYYIGDRQQLHICLWGTEEYYFLHDAENDAAWKKECDLLTINGTFYWMAWYPTKEALVSLWEAEQDKWQKWHIANTIFSVTEDETYRDLTRPLFRESGAA